MTFFGGRPSSARATASSFNAAASTSSDFAAARNHEFVPSLTINLYGNGHLIVNE